MYTGQINKKFYLFFFITSVRPFPVGKQKKSFKEIKRSQIWYRCEQQNFEGRLFYDCENV